MKNIKKVVRFILKYPVFILLSIVFDVLFLFFFGFFTGLVKNRLAELVTIIVSSIPSALESLDSVSITNLLFSVEIKPFLFNLLFFIMLFYLLVFFVFIVFQGLAWWVAFIITKQKPFKSFFIPFLKCCLFWGIILAILHFANLIVDLRFIVLKSVSPTAINILGSVFDVLFILAGVFTLFSLSSLSLFGFFKIRFKKILCIALIVCTVLCAAYFVPFLIGKFSRVLALILSFLLLLPGFLFIRVFTIKMLNLKD